MVYINELSGTISIPKHTVESASKYTLILTSNLSNEVTLVDEGSNISTNSLYYKFTLNVPNLNVGEYTYTLYGNDKVIEQGLLVYGDYNRQVIVNNTTTKNKVQYNG